MLVCLSFQLWGSGQSYSETQEEAEGAAAWQELFVSDSVIQREYVVGLFTKIELVGDMHVSIMEGSEPKLTLTANRALMGQVSVTNWNGVLTVKVESGLLGPRERGKLEVVLVPGSAVRIETLEGVKLRGSLNSELEVSLVLRSASQAILAMNVKALNLELTWNSQVQLSGNTESTTVASRDPARIDLSGLKTGRLRLQIRDRADLILGTTGTVTGEAGRASVLWVENPDDFQGANPELKILGELRDKSDRTAPGS